MRIRPVHWTGFGIWVLLGLVLVLQYVGGWYALQLARVSKEQDLEQHLEDVGRMGAEFLTEAALSLSDLEQDATWAASAKATAGATVAPDLEYYRKALEPELTRRIGDFSRDARLAGVVVLGEQGRILFDTRQSGDLLQPFEFKDIDAMEIAQAREGSPSSSLAYAVADQPFKRFYVPVGEGSSSSSHVRTIICLIAGRDYLAQLQSLAVQLMRLRTILTLIVALVAWLVWRLLSRQRRMERHAADNDRLAGLGRLAAGFAHELRNPLGIIRSFTEDLEQSLRREDHNLEAQEACREIVEEVDRMNRLVGQFLEYSREGRAPGGGTELTAVAACVQTVINILRPLAEKREVSLAWEPWGSASEAVQDLRARIDGGRLKQVLMNLALNAIEVSPSGGRVAIELEASARQLALRVRDQGPGVDPKSERRIFEPFFTTRPGGSGLGLAVSRQIAQAAGGQLDLEHHGGQGEGACFCLRLQRGPDRSSAQPAPKEAATAT